MTVDLATRYMGLLLRNPLVAAASPLTGDLATLRELEQAGVGAVTLPSLFQEEVEHDEMAIHELLGFGAEGFAEATSFVPALGENVSGPERHLRFVEQAREALEIPLIASLNGTTTGGWIDHARRLEACGIDALELNIYWLETDPEISGAEVESRYAELVAAVRSEIEIPLAVKIGPFFSSPAHLLRRLTRSGADGLVLFNRFLQPDIDLDTLRVSPELVLSRSWEARLPLRWIAILHGRLEASLAATSGAHTAEDAVKLLLAGADVVTMASALLEDGPGHATGVISGIAEWLERNGYDSVAQARGSMSYANCPDPAALERANYMRTLRSWSGGGR